MVNVSDYLNRRYSTRNLGDAEFLAILPDLAAAVAAVDPTPVYTQDDLRGDWRKLLAWTPVGPSINSTSRVGLKLCEHFFPNFLDIRDSRGNSFRSLWTPTNLERILRWNRQSHSTPYLSELKRGVYFCCGLPKSTMYRPQAMKAACTIYGARAVLDPCAGWGGRMLGAVAAGCTYTAFEPNTETYSNLLRLADFLDIRSKVTLICDDARNIGSYGLDKADLVLTSPPYFNLEVYTDEASQSITGYSRYQDWVTGFLEPVVAGCLDRLDPRAASCWNVGKVAGHDMAADILRIHSQYGWVPAGRIDVVSSKRQINQKPGASVKNADTTVVYRPAGVSIMDNTAAF